VVSNGGGKWVQGRSGSKRSRQKGEKAQKKEDRPKEALSSAKKTSMNGKPEKA
jgi:hypothetical protein